MHFHLVSYATTKYRHRQVFLAASARANGIVESARSWTAAQLAASEFTKIAPNILLTERGSGFWAWKPFIIQKSLASLSDGEILLYCDVGRKYPYILLEHPLDSFVSWMDDHSQDIVPGVLIPWNGPMETWTKGEAFTGTGMNRSNVRKAIPIQASFSFWRASPQSKRFVAEWLSWCVQRNLINDDHSADGEPEVPVFRGHRHDQSLMTLCCLKNGVRGIDLGPEIPSFNERDPGQVAHHLFGTRPQLTLRGKLVRSAAKPVQFIEQNLRERITFGQKYE
ncbi:MAG: hypothetical protein H7Y36_00650 [Armatimonadetes bacterium]|nr:hypothetical protein [Akkermansiaceae bacterium]